MDVWCEAFCCRHINFKTVFQSAPKHAIFIQKIEKFWMKMPHFMIGAPCSFQCHTPVVFCSFVLCSFTKFYPGYIFRYIPAGGKDPSRTHSPPRRFRRSTLAALYKILNMPLILIPGIQRAQVSQRNRATPVLMWQHIKSRQPLQMSREDNVVHEVDGSVSSRSTCNCLTGFIILSNLPKNGIV